jgi:single-strand DNA-binding protein
MNKVILIGRLTKDAEIRTTQTGKKVASFSLAISEGKDNVQFFNCTAWEQRATVIENYTKKGSLIAIDGKLKNESYEKDGVKHYNTKIDVFAVELLSSKSETQTESTTVTQSQSDTLPEVDVDSMNVQMPW